MQKKERARARMARMRVWFIRSTWSHCEQERPDTQVVWTYIYWHRFAWAHARAANYSRFCFLFISGTFLGKQSRTDTNYAIPIDDAERKPNKKNRPCRRWCALVFFHCIRGDRECLQLTQITCRMSTHQPSQTREPNERKCSRTKNCVMSSWVAWKQTWMKWTNKMYSPE